MATEEEKPAEFSAAANETNTGTTWNVDESWILPQKKAFTVWVNTFLAMRGMEIDTTATPEPAEEGAEPPSVYVDGAFTDGVRLINFLEECSGKSIRTKYKAKPKSRIDKVDNIGLAVKFMEELGLRRTTVSAEDFADAREKAVLGFVWSMFKHFGQKKAGKGKNPLLQWAVEQTRDYANVEITNFSASFKDGLAFCALLHSLNPSLFDFDELDAKDARGNLTLAFDMLSEHYQIPRILDVNDMIEFAPDSKSVEMYVTLIYNRVNLEEELRKKEEALSGALGGAEKLAAEKANLELSKLSLADAKAHLEERVHVLEEELDHTKKDLEDTKAELADTEHDVESLTFQKTLMETAIERRDQELNILTIKYNEGVKQYEQAMEKQATTESELAQANAERVSLTGKLEEVEKEKAHLDELLVISHHEKMTTLEELVDTKETLQAQIHKTDVEVAAHGETLEALAAAREETATLVKEKEDLSSSLENLKAESQRQKELREAMAAENENELSKRIEDLAAENASMAQQIEQLTKQNAALTAQGEADRTKATEDAATAASRISNLETEVTNWRDLYERHMVECADHNKAMDAKVAAMTAEAKALEDYIEGQKDEIRRQARILGEERRKLEKERAVLELSNADFEVVLAKLQNMYDYFDDPMLLTKVVFGKNQTGAANINGNTEDTLDVKVEGKMKGWHKRYVVAKDNFIFVYKDDTQPDPLLVLRIDKALTSVEVEKDRKFIIKINPPHSKALFLSCADQEDYDNWLEQLAAARHFWDRRENLVQSSKAANARAPLARMLGMLVAVGLPTGMFLGPEGLTSLDDKKDSHKGKSLKELADEYNKTREAVIEANVAVQNSTPALAPELVKEMRAKIALRDARIAAMTPYMKGMGSMPSPEHEEMLKKRLMSANLTKATETVARAKAEAASRAAAEKGGQRSAKSIAAQRSGGAQGRVMSEHAERMEQLGIVAKAKADAGNTGDGSLPLME